MRRFLAALLLLTLAACAPQQANAPARDPIAAVTVFFDTGSDELSLVASAALERAAERMRADPNLRGRIEGFADSRGNAADNIVLSNRRAQAVRDFLTARGVASGRLALVAMGGAGTGAAAEALERRVVLRLE